MKSNTYFLAPTGARRAFACCAAACASILLTGSLICPPAAHAEPDFTHVASSMHEVFEKNGLVMPETKTTISRMETFRLEKAAIEHPLLDETSKDIAVETLAEAEAEAQGAKKTSYVENETSTEDLKGASGTIEDLAVAVDAKANGKEVPELGDELKETLDAAASEKKDQQDKYEAYLASEQGIRDQLVQAALTRQGVPYVYGGTDPENGMDCSGFTQWCYSQIGISIGRTSYDQEGGAVEIVAVEDAKPGDILCAGGHVALYIGDGQMIHEPQSGDVCRISDDLAQFYCAARYI